MSTIKMKAPLGSEGQEASIEGHSYKIPKSGIIEVVSPLHVETLQRHGFTDHVEETPFDIDGCDDKAELVEFIEEHGGEADDSMSLKKLRRLAHEAISNED